MTKPLTPDLARKILYYMSRVHQPVYLGFIALDIGYSLRQTEAWVETLVEQGKVRRLTPNQLVQYGFDDRGVVYERTGR